MTTEITDLDARLRGLNASQRRIIRDAYYHAVDSLRTLADALERADTDQTDAGQSPLLTEHFIAIQAMDAMDASELGKCL